MAIIEKPLNVFEIANQLGYYEYAPHPVTGQTVRKVDVGRLCTHPNINKWSFYKPVKMSGVNEKSETDFFNVNDGFDIPSFAHAPLLFNAILDGANDWQYIKPIGGVVSPYRVSDFTGYNKDSERWYNGSLSTNQVEVNTSFRITLDKDLSWLIANFEKFKFAFNNGNPYTNAVNVGLLLRSESSSPTANNVYYYKICDWLDLSDNLDINIPSMALPFGSYNIVPVLTSATSYDVGSLTSIVSTSPSLGSWFGLPTQMMTINIVEGGTSTINKIDFNLASYDISDNGYNLTINSLFLDFSNSNNLDTDINISIEIMDSVTTDITTTSMTLQKNSNVTRNILSGHTYTSATGNTIVKIIVSVGYASKEEIYQLFEK